MQAQKKLKKNISDIRKGKFDSLDKSLSSGYISRNEMRINNKMKQISDKITRVTLRKFQESDKYY